MKATRLVCLSGLVTVLFALPCAIRAQESKKPAAKPVPDRATLEKQFAETMSGATLVGRFTVTGKPEEKNPKEDKYTLGPVKKLKGDYWSFETRIQYGDHDVKVPLAIEVLWAGDTPIITLTDFEVPGLGRFTARVLVYRDHYSGYWDAGDHGGLMFGKIVREDTAESKK